VAKEKSDEISLIEAENEANNTFISKFFNEKQWSFSHFTRHPIRTKVSNSFSKIKIKTNLILEPL